MTSSLFYNTVSAQNYGPAANLGFIRSSPERFEETYEVDLIQFHAFYSHVTYRQDSWEEDMHTGPALRLSSVSAVKAEVYRNSTVVVSKRSRLSFCGASQAPAAEVKQFITEFLILSHPYLRQHENIVNLTGFAWECSSDAGVADYKSVIWPTLMIECGTRGTMTAYLAGLAPDEDLDVRQILCADVARGLLSLHECSIVHGDLKPDNVVISSDRNSPTRLVAKICDFDLSMIVDNTDEHSTFHLPGGTQAWAAPEASSPLSVTDIFQTDVYSFGLLVWSVFHSQGRPLELDAYVTDEVDDQGSMNSRVVQYACSKTMQFFQRMKSINIDKRRKEELTRTLCQVFESTLNLSPQARFLHDAAKSLSTDITASVSDDSSQDASATWWPALYYKPRQLSICSPTLKSLKGDLYFSTPGSLEVAKASISTCERLWLDQKSHTAIMLSDAAFFLFRAYSEAYGVRDSPENTKTAIDWLTRALQMEIQNDGPVAPWVLHIHEYFEYLDAPIPSLHGQKDMMYKSLKSMFSLLTYPLKLMEKVASQHGISFDEMLSCFRKEGLFGMHEIDSEIKHVLTSKVQHFDIRRLPDANKALTPNGFTLIHFAASCGSLSFLRDLKESFPIDLNVRDSHGVTPAMLALHFSHMDMLEWILTQLSPRPTNCEKVFGDLSNDIWSLSFQNFREYEYARFAKLLCLMHSEDVTEADYDDVVVHTLFRAIEARDQAMVRKILDTDIRKANCIPALEAAAINCCLEIFLLIENHLRIKFNYEPDAPYSMHLFLLLITTTPFSRCGSEGKSEFSAFARLLRSRLGEPPHQFGLGTLYDWHLHAIRSADTASFELVIAEPGFEQLKFRCPSPDQDSGTPLRSRLESAVYVDCLQVFQYFLSKGDPVKQKQVPGLCPTLFHLAARRELLHATNFINIIAAHGEDISICSNEYQYWNSALGTAIHEDKMEAAEALIRLGAPLENDDSPYNDAPMISLVRSMDIRAVPRIEYLLTHPCVTPNFITDEYTKKSILHRAAGPVFMTRGALWRNDVSLLEGPKTILKTLLKHYNTPGHLNARTIFGVTPLHVASHMGCDWAVELLLEAGADAYARTCQGFLPHRYAGSRFPHEIPSYEKMLGRFDPVTQKTGIASVEGQKRCLDLYRKCYETNGWPSLSWWRRVLGLTGLMDLSKADDADYEWWPGQTVSPIARFLVKQRKLRHAQNSNKSK